MTPVQSDWINARAEIDCLQTERASVKRIKRHKGLLSVGITVASAYFSALTTRSPTETGRLSLPRRPSLGLLKSQSSLVVPLASTVPEVFVKGPAPPVSDGSSCDPAQPMIKPGEHQLKHEWTLYTDPKFEGINKKLTQESYSLSRIESFRSVEEFARLFNYLKRPSKLPDQTNLAMFKDGIEPTWEAPGNQGGGTWTMFLASDQSIDIIFKEATLALVGAQLPDEQLCGLGTPLFFWLIHFVLLAQLNCDNSGQSAKQGRQAAILAAHNQPN